MLDCCLPDLQDPKSAVDHVLVRNQNGAIYAPWHLIYLCSYLVGLSLPPRPAHCSSKKNVTFSEKRPGCRNANLVSALGVTQRDPLPLF